jgi:hypothetical protein
VGAGLGGLYFLSAHVFIGGEARLRFARGTYALRLSEGVHDFQEDERRWGRVVVNTALFVGLRP